MKRLNRIALAGVASAGLLAGLGATAPAAQAAPVTAEVQPNGSTCDTFPWLCTYLKNVGSYDLRIDTNDRDGVQAWNAWLKAGHNTTSDKRYDIAGFYLPKGSCAWTRSGGSGSPKTSWGSKTKNVYVAMTDYDKWDVATFFCS